MDFWVKSTLPNTPSNWRYSTYTPLALDTTMWHRRHANLRKLKSAKCRAWISKSLHSQNGQHTSNLSQRRTLRHGSVSPTEAPTSWPSRTRTRYQNGRGPESLGKAPMFSTIDANSEYSPMEINDWDKNKATSHRIMGCTDSWNALWSEERAEYEGWT